MDGVDGVDSVDGAGGAGTSSDGHMTALVEDWINAVKVRAHRYMPIAQHLLA